MRRCANRAASTRWFVLAGLAALVATAPAAAAPGWSEVAPLPSARLGVAAAAVGSTLYSIGGNTGEGVDLTEVLTYTSATGHWQPRASLPRPTEADGAVAVDGHGRI